MELKVHRVLIPTYLIGFSEKLQNLNAPCQTAISRPGAAGSPRFVAEGRLRAGSGEIGLYQEEGPEG
jgi:hypothetical protein